MTAVREAFPSFESTTDEELPLLLSGDKVEDERRVEEVSVGIFAFATVTVVEPLMTCVPFAGTVVRTVFVKVGVETVEIELLWAVEFELSTVEPPEIGVEPGCKPSATTFTESWKFPT
jgi:hypothetical protein